MNLPGELVVSRAPPIRSLSLSLISSAYQLHGNFLASHYSARLGLIDYCGAGSDGTVVAAGRSSYACCGLRAGERSEPADRNGLVRYCSVITAMIPAYPVSAETKPLNVCVIRVAPSRIRFRKYYYFSQNFLSRFRKLRQRHAPVVVGPVCWEAKNIDRQWRDRFACSNRCSAASKAKLAKPSRDQLAK